MTDEKVNILLVDDRPENLLALEGVLLDLGQNLFRQDEKAFPCGAEGQRLRFAREQRRAGPVFDYLELMAERRLGQVEQLGSPGQTARSLEGTQGTEMTEFQR